jgi:hypothetical protein
LSQRDVQFCLEYEARHVRGVAPVADVSRSATPTNSSVELDEPEPEPARDVAELVAELAPPVHREVPLRVDAQLAGVLDAGRRAAESGVQWMERACAQFESIARLATERAVQTERQLVDALTGLADARAGELGDDDDAPEAPAGGMLDEALMGELLGALQQQRGGAASPVAAPVAKRDT